MNWFSKPKEEVKVTIVDLKSVIDLSTLAESRRVEVHRLQHEIAEANSKLREFERFFNCAKAEIAQLKAKLSDALPFQNQNLSEPLRPKDDEYPDPEYPDLK